MTISLDTPDHFHPYECNGPGHCIHCDRARTGDHDPETCPLCEDLLWFQADEEEESMTAIQDAASKVQEIAAAIGAVDLSQETEQIEAGISGIQQELFALADQLRGIEPGEEAPPPGGVPNVDLAQAEAAAAAEDESAAEDTGEGEEEEPAG